MEAQTGQHHSCCCFSIITEQQQWLEVVHNDARAHENLRAIARQISYVAYPVTCFPAIQKIILYNLHARLARRNIVDRTFVTVNTAKMCFFIHLASVYYGVKPFCVYTLFNVFIFNFQLP